MTSSAKLTSVLGRVGGVTKAYDDSGAIASRAGTRAWANNNPGNMEYGPTARALGAIGSDGRFAVFASPEDGFNAAKALFSGTTPRPTANALYQNGTVAQNVAHWAPSFENDVSAYTKALSVAGVSPNTRVQDMTPDQLNAVIGAMSVHEGYAPGVETAVSGYQTPPGTTSLNAMAGWKGKPGELGTPEDQSQPPTQETYSPTAPDKSVNPYGGLLGGLGAGVTAAIQGFNGLGNIASSIGGLFSPTQRPSYDPLSSISPPSTFAAPAPGAVTSAPMPAISLPHPQSSPYGPPAVSQPAHPSTPTPQDGGLGGLLGTLGRAAIGGPLGGSYQSTAGSNNPYQGASHPYESGYTPSYSQLAPGAATATQMFGADPSPVATDKPSFTTTRSLNPNYQSQMAAYNAALNANVPSAVDSFAAAPGLSAVTDPGANPWGEFDGPPKAPTAPRIGPAPSKYITTQVPTAPSLPSFAVGSPVYSDDGKITGAIGANGKAFTPDFAPNTAVTDQTGKTVGTISGHTMQAQKLGLLGQLSSLFGGPALPTVPGMISNVIGGAYGTPGGMSSGMGSNGAGLVGGMAPGGLNAYGNMKAGGWGNSGNGSMGGGYHTSNDGGNLHG